MRGATCAAVLLFASSAVHAERLKPNYIACDTADHLIAYTVAGVSKNRSVLQSLWNKSCFSTNRLAHVPDVKVLIAGPLITRIRVAAGGDAVDVWTQAEALDQ
jgi:hypothetical protein